MVLIGIALLYAGGELLVRGAVDFSRIFGLSPMVVGLTVVAFGTSTPELASSLIAVFRGADAIALGNVIGSNSTNIGLILGVAALVNPIGAHGRFIVRDMSVLIAVSLLLPLLLAGGAITRSEGVFLALLIGPYLWLLLRAKESDEIEQEFATEYSDRKDRPSLVAVLLVAGVAMLVLGATALVDGAVSVARAFGITERVIGVTLVALGTSLPELATSAIAAYKREGDIALGNVIGSNVFNILAVLGITATIRPISVIAESLTLDIAVMVAFTGLLIPFAMSGRRIARIEGLVLLCGYAAYVTYLYVF